MRVIMTREIGSAIGVITATGVASSTSFGSALDEIYFEN
jgi:hypothetical protein